MLAGSENFKPLQLQVVQRTDLWISSAYRSGCIVNNFLGQRGVSALFVPGL